MNALHLGELIVAWPILFHTCVEQGAHEEDHEARGEREVGARARRPLTSEQLAGVVERQAERLSIGREVRVMHHVVEQRLGDVDDVESFGVRDPDEAYPPLVEDVAGLDRGMDRSRSFSRAMGIFAVAGRAEVNELGVGLLEADLLERAPGGEFGEAAAVGIAVDSLTRAIARMLSAM